MKKVFAVLSLALLGAAYPISGFAQGVTFGAKAGLNLANLGGTDADDLDSKTGFALGGFANYQINDQFAFQPELSFSQKGASQKVSDGSGGTMDVTLNYSYIEVPVLAKYSLALQGGGNLRPALFAGPAVGLLVGAKAKAESDNDPRLFMTAV